MATSAAVHPGPPRVVRAPRPLVLSAIAAAGLAVAAVTFAYGLRDEGITWHEVALFEWMGVPYIVAGVIAWWRRPDSRLGPLMLAGGFGVVLGGLQFVHHDLPYTFGWVFDLLPAALFLHVFLAFPDGRLQSRLERLLVAAAYASALGLQLARMALGHYDSLLAFWYEPHAALTVLRVEALTLSALLLVGIGVLLVRRRAGRPRRALLAVSIDLFALGLLIGAVFFVAAAYDGPYVSALRHATYAVVGLAPLVFLLGLLDARLARSAVGDLMLELRADLSPAALRAALARTLRDPSLTLAYWLPDYEVYADLDGQAVEVGADGRSVTPIDRNGSRVAALVHDRALDDEPELLAAVGAAAGIALENGRLQAELAARLEEVRGSRARVLEAGQKERQRLERNLHDGAQQRLVALSLELKLLERQLSENPEARKRLDEAQREVEQSLADLRDLARGIHPAVVTAHGLAVALEQVAARAPVPVRLSVDVDGRLPEQVEVAAYYVVTESLANMAKHANATRGSVQVRRAGDRAVVEIVDDGVGGADTERGSGLRGLADRVEALGGTLRVWTPRGGGTRVRAEIPCG